MATLDVTDVLDDPDFQSEAILIRAVSDVDDRGLAWARAKGQAFQGVIWPGNGKGLVRTGEGDFVEGDLAIVTRLPIDTGTRETAADGVIYGGLVYVVTNAQAWNFGAGFTQVVCKLRTLNPSAAGGKRYVGALG